MAHGDSDPLQHGDGRPEGTPWPADARLAGQHSATVERTELSWVRAALSVVLTSTLLFKHALAVGGPVGLVIGAVVMLVGAAAAYVPIRRHVVTSGSGEIRTGAVRAAAAVAIGIGVLSLVVLVIPEH